MIVLLSPSVQRTRAGPCVYWSAPVHLRVSCRAAPDSATVASSDTAIETLKQAAGKVKSKDKVPAKDVFNCLRLLQKSNLKGDWGPAVGCNEYWRLVYTANSEAMQASNKSPEDGTGYYFPAIATNKLALTGPESGEMKTATYLPHIAAVEFTGQYSIKGVQSMMQRSLSVMQKLTNFDMAELRVKLGPWVLGPFSIPSQVKDGKGPFFNFFYADEYIACAVGRSGGIAMWAKAEQTFIAEKGIVL